MGTVTVFHTTGGDNGVPDFSDNIQLSLKLPGGKYVVHARIELGNFDGDSQSTSCGIRVRSSLRFIDRLDFDLLGGGRAYLALQGVCDLRERDDTIDLTAGTFNGFSNQTSLIAISVDDIKPPA
jgi:hypothetical protein